jgi:hypothetical protein
MKHKLLIRQVKKHLYGMKNIHPDLKNFLTAVNFSYQQFDGDYFLLVRTMKSSRKGFSSPLKDCTEDRLTWEQGVVWLSARRLHGGMHISKNSIGRRQKIQRHSA